MGKMVSSGPSLEPAPEGLHAAVCVDVVELGMVDSPWGPKDTIELRWQVFPVAWDESDPPVPTPVRQESGKPFMVISRYNATLNEKANLYKHLVAWRGRKFTEAELQGFDLDNVIGKPCQLQLIHNAGNNGKTYANIQAIVPFDKRLTPPVPEDYVRVCDRKDEQNGHQAPTEDDSDVPF